MLLAEEASFVEKVAVAIYEGRDLPSRSDPGGQDHIAALISPIGFEDPEYLDGRGLQRKLSDFCDEKEFSDLVGDFSVAEKWEDVSRLQDLRQALSPVANRWMWRLHPAQGEIVPPRDFGIGVRIRLGTQCLEDPIPCHRCVKKLDSQGYHALCCALPEANRGHNRARDQVLNLFHLADASAYREMSS